MSPKPVGFSLTIMISAKLIYQVSTPNWYSTSGFIVVRRFIAENIALNDPQATTESIIDAAKLACAHEFIMSLSKVMLLASEKGSNLSGGQRQRIAIAGLFFPILSFS